MAFGEYHWEVHEGYSLKDNSYSLSSQISERELHGDMQLFPYYLTPSKGALIVKHLILLVDFGSTPEFKVG